MEEELVDVFGPDKTKVTNKALPGLLAALSEHKQAGRLDGFGLYLFGVVLKVSFLSTALSLPSCLIPRRLAC